MKVLLALAVLATSATSFASERALYDIMYLPKAGTTYGISQAEYLKGGFEILSTDVDISGYRFVQTVGHSFTDRLSLNLAVNYSNLELDVDGGSNTETSGISDPRLEARFRAMDEAFRLDFLGGVVVGMGDSETKSNGDSNNLQGGNSAFVGAQFGGKNEFFQWAVLGQVTHNMKAENEDKSTTPDTNTEDDANNELQLRGDILNKLAEKSFMRSFVSADFNEGYDDDNNSDTASATTYALGTEYQHLCTQNLLLRAGVDYGMTNQNTGIVEDNTLWIVRVGANYQF